MSFYRIAAEAPSSPVSLQCELLGVSTSGYYEWARRAPSDRALGDAFLVEGIKEIHAQARGVYGRQGSTPSCATLTGFGWARSVWRG